MNVETTRFGVVNVDEDRILTFPAGLLGFSSFKKYALLQPHDDEAPQCRRAGSRGRPVPSRGLAGRPTTRYRRKSSKLKSVSRLAVIRPACNCCCKDANRMAASE